MRAGRCQKRRENLQGRTVGGGVRAPWRERKRARDDGCLCYIRSAVRSQRRRLKVSVRVHKKTKQKNKKGCIYVRKSSSYSEPGYALVFWKRHSHYIILREVCTSKVAKCFLIQSVRDRVFPLASRTQLAFKPQNIQG